MDVQVIEGRFAEVPTADARGVDRRAFGEFIGPQGELASYAIGWTTGTDQHVGRISIGIGAGNPGGATIHAVVFDNGNEYAFSLIDEPFEQVPQGGPHLTAQQARAHEDLPFMWWVADYVFATDRRAWWLRHWLLRTNCIQTAEVFDLREPILLVGHDEDDGIWQLIGTSDAGPDGKLGHLSHAIDEDQTLLDVLNLQPGQSAVRQAVGGPWTRQLGYPD
ncbi:hypothetical protein ACFCV3_22425 [Kribbella sp. NPDC056345]|uniref:hypothetical protein n=1 Tax=Kribbella sp. NPDC056345 TaxID=3345789 RepID=UPI0035D56307